MRINQPRNNRTTANINDSLCFAFPLKLSSRPNNDTSGYANRRLLDNLQLAHSSAVLWACALCSNQLRYACDEDLRLHLMLGMSRPRCAAVARASSYPASA